MNTPDNYILVNNVKVEWFYDNEFVDALVWFYNKNINDNEVIDFLDKNNYPRKYANKIVELRKQFC